MKNMKIELGSTYLVSKDYTINLFTKFNLKGNNITLEEYDEKDKVYYFRSSNPYTPCFGIEWEEIRSCIKSNTFVFLRLEDLTDDKYNYLRDNSLATVTFDTQGNYNIKD